jgi:phage protein D
MTTRSAYHSQAHISIDGQNTPGLTRDAVAALVEETIDGLYRCEITLVNYGTGQSGRADYLYFGRQLLDFGKEVVLRLGGDDPPEQVFAGRITAIEAEYREDDQVRLRILAEDRLQDLRMTRRTRSFEDKTDADVLQQIAREHQLQADVDLPGPTHARIAQVNLSDLAFIRQRAHACGGEIWVDGGTLYARTRTGRDVNPIDLAYGVGLQSFSVRADLAQQCTEYRVTGWDIESKSSISENGTASDIASELEGGDGGGAILEEKFGARPASLVHQMLLTQQEARGLAEARYRQHARRFVTGSGLADGNPRIRAGVTVNLLLLGEMFDGAYSVVAVRHLFTLENGYQTEFDVERPWIGRV